MGALALLIVIILTVILVLYQRRKYYEKQGIPYTGSGLRKLVRFFGGSASLIQLEREMYHEVSQSASPLVGVSDIFGQSLLVVNSLDLAKHILIKDFSHFVNRRPFKTQQSTNNWFKRMLFFLENDQWKGVRARLSPTFTTARIRTMFEIFKSSSDRLDGYLKEQMHYPSGHTMEIDFTQVTRKYTVDVIANCVFGVDSQSWECPPGKRSMFEDHSQKVSLQFTPKSVAIFFIMTVAPKLADKLELDIFNREAQSYFADIISQVIKQRRETGERRQDFLQLMLDAQQGILEADEETSQVMNGTLDGTGKGLRQEPLGKTVAFSDDDVIANAIIFLIAGFDSVQSVLVFTLYSLALEPEVQDKVYQEILSALNRHKGELTYDALSNMKYLDMVINECLRKYPPSIRVERYCNKEYPVPGTNFVIEKGTVVSLPVIGIHHDPQYFPNPEKFIPERFSPENKASLSPYALMPFGHGPRNCIGMRFALIEVKAVIAQLVNSFHFTPCSKTKFPVEFSSSATLSPKGGMWLRLTARK